MSQEIPFPAAVDEATPIAGTITTDELIPVALGIIVGIVTEHIRVFLPIGIAMVFIYRRVKETQPAGFVKHWLYYHGIYSENNKEFAEPFKRKWVG